MYIWGQMAGQPPSSADSDANGRRQASLSAGSGMPPAGLGMAEVAFGPSSVAKKQWIQQLLEEFARSAAVHAPKQPAVSAAMTNAPMLWSAQTLETRLTSWARQVQPAAGMRPGVVGSHWPALAVDHHIPPPNRWTRPCFHQSPVRAWLIIMTVN